MTARESERVNVKGLVWGYRGFWGSLGVRSRPKTPPTSPNIPKHPRDIAQKKHENQTQHTHADSEKGYADDFMIPLDEDDSGGG